MKNACSTPEINTMYFFGELALDLRNGYVSGPDGDRHLTPMECRLLKTFVQNKGKVVPRAHLMQTVWETNYLGDTRTLDVHMSWLRKKIGECSRKPRYLWTVRGIGYCFGIDGVGT